MVRLLVVAVTLVFALPAPPVSADAPKPGDYRSEVLRSSPELPEGVEVRVVGGDSFLEVTVAPGHTVVVPDYGTTSTPYLRFGRSGRVERNRLATATAANESRFGADAATPDPDAEPRWEVVSTDGFFAWHDHRIHWMAPTPPRAVDAGGRVDLGGPSGTWRVDLIVDGRPTVIIGQLLLEPRPTPVGWMALGAVVAVGLVLAALRRGIVPALGAASIVSVGSLAAAWSTWDAAPGGSGASWIPVVITAIALGAAGLAALGPAKARIAAVGACAAALLGWAGTRWTVLARAELPTTLPFWIDRMTTAAALGAGAGLAILLVWQPSVVTGTGTTGNPLRRATKSA